MVAAPKTEAMAVEVAEARVPGKQAKELVALPVLLLLRIDPLFFVLALQRAVQSTSCLLLLYYFPPPSN